MNPKPDLDPDLAAQSRLRYLPARTCGSLLLLALVSGLAVLSSRVALTPPAIARSAVPVLTAGGLTIGPTAPGAPTTLISPQPGDHFVVMASPAIDPQMVHPAPDGIDEGMVFPSGERQLAPAVPVAPPGAVPLAPGYFPVPPDGTMPDQEITPQVLPQAPVPANPQ